MTPEEQFMKIENALRHAAEIQSQHAESFARHEEAIARNAEAIARHAEAITRDEAAIRDLIVVSRTLVDTAKLHGDAFNRADEVRTRDHEEFNVRFNALLHAQLETEKKLQRWIDRQGHA